uniref:Uncharacterized protein n=1 Tax=Cruciviridae sp. TaxID=1955495 RepID=A0A1S6LVI8_9VIRU|nr:hypothetical protein [Cruciviridae sp.]
MQLWVSVIFFVLSEIWCVCSLLSAESKSVVRFVRSFLGPVRFSTFMMEMLRGSGLYSIRTGWL